VKPKLTEKEALQKAISEAVKYLTRNQKAEVLKQIRLLLGKWNGELNEIIGLLSMEQAKQILEFIALMPGEGKGRIYPDEKPLL
jgi:hypothetical protein